MKARWQGAGAIALILAGAAGGACGGAGAGRPARRQPNGDWNPGWDAAAAAGIPARRELAFAPSPAAAYCPSAGNARWRSSGATVIVQVSGIDAGLKQISSSHAW